MTMVGGAKFQESVIEWSKKSTNLYTFVFAVLIAVWALYAAKLPALARWQLSSTAGRLLLLLLLYIVYDMCGWTVALIFTIAVALTWAARPLFVPAYVPEGFANMKTTDASAQKWFVEKVLHQNPKKIVEDRIDTMAVEEDSPTVTSRTSK